MNLTSPQINTKILFILFAFSSFTINSQDLTNNLKIWSGVSVSYSINENLTGKLNQLFAFKITPGRYSFSQTDLSLSYKINSKTFVKMGYVRGLFNDSNSLRRQGAISGWFNTLLVQRVYGSFSYKQQFFERFSLKHTIEFQYFFPDLKKYKTRTKYSARISYNIRKSSLTPYLENQFYFYQGGIISNGIKRYRLKSGFRFKPVKDSSMRLSIYYIFQNEFNTDQLSDNDYAVFGFNLSFKIKNKSIK